MSTTATEAPTRKGRAKKGEDKGVKATAKATTKRTKYPDNIRAAAKRARELAGDSMAPGPKQHVLVRKALGDREPVKASGMSLAALRRYARGEDTYSRTAPETKAIRDLANEVNDPFTRGRSLAGVLIAFHEELAAAKK